MTHLPHRRCNENRTDPRGEPRTSRYLRRSYSTGFADALARPLARKVTPASFKRARTSAPPPDPDELPPAARCDVATEVGQSLESLKWFLWHGNVFRALQTIEDLECQLDDVGGGGHFEQVRLVKAVHESDTRMFTRGRVPRPNRRQTPSGNDRSPRAQ